MLRSLFFSILLIPAVSVARGWDLRIGVSEFPKQNTLLSVELTHIHELSPGVELGLGGTLKTDFSQSMGLGALGRLRYWFIEQMALGAVSEYGYMMHNRFSDPDSFSYLFAGPLLGIRLPPPFIQWEPGILFYQGTNEFVPLRLVFGFSF